jgi:ATP-dependent 26S proteasome regulatory subunit
VLTRLPRVPQVGYDDVGGVRKQMAQIRELVRCCAGAWHSPCLPRFP